MAPINPLGLAEPWEPAYLADIGLLTKGYDWDDSRGVAFVVGEVGTEFDLFGVDGVTLRPGDCGGRDFVRP
jgi:hypothetical protein